MKLTEKISWLMGRVQRSLFPHLNECLQAPLTEQEKRLVAILEIVEVERYVPRVVTRYRYPGRKPLDRQALGRAFVAKALLPDNQRSAPSPASDNQLAQDMRIRHYGFLALGGHLFLGLCHIRCWQPWQCGT